jgi:uncharacterized protein (DUF362 family)
MTDIEPNPVVSIAKGDDQLDTARRCLGYRLRAVVWPGARVLLKVNQVGGLPPENGSTVGPELIGLVVEMCREAGAGQVGIAEDAGRFNDTLAVFERLGTTAVARRTGATLIDLRQQPHVLRPVPGGGLVASEIEFSQPLLEWDVVIGVTKLKTHHQTGITGALKNFFGAIPDDYKRRFHRLDMDKAIVDINSIRHADFTIVDGFPAMEGVGPHQGTPVPMNIAICGADPVAVDAVCQAVMGFGPNFGRHVRIAAQQDLGVNDLARIQVQGTPIAEVRRPFQTALDQIKERMAGYVQVIDHTDCSGCACAVATTFMLLLGRHGKSLEEFKGLKVYLGKVDVPEGSQGDLLVGNCVRGPEGHRRWLRVEGGPPSISAIMDSVSSSDVELTSFGREVE